MKHPNTAPSCSTKKTTIGGQAIIEGIVMKGPRASCTVVRKSNAELVIRDEPRTPPAERHPILGWPLVRGVVTFVDALRDGMEALDYSAKFIDEEVDEVPSKFEAWLEARLGTEKVTKFLMGLATAFGVVVPVLLFFLLPTLLTSPLPQDTPQLARNLVEGVVRIVIFLGFMWAISHMKDIRRTFEYHGAEHKTIFCYEAGEELTVGNVRRQDRFHPRCGTSFLFVVIILSILISSVVFSFFTPPNAIWRFIGHLILLPLVVGLSYEINRYAGRVDNGLTRALRWPGVQVQHLTVFEPDDDMIEVAIEAMKRVIPNDDSDNW